METKLLTISVAAYNVEQYLENTLNSLCNPEILKYLEVFVIDDGGKDKSLGIATKFQNMYPNSFHAIHKENGGYGSTVAYSIEHATGKYFKLLDGDDWFDEKGIAEVISRLKETDVDIIITDYLTGEDRENLTLMPCYQPDGTVISVKDYRSKYSHGMWSLFYKTQLLKDSNMEFPLHTLYTDQIYATIPFAYAQNICFIQTPVYCYRFGRNEQSTSKPSRIKHADEMFEVCRILYDFYENNREKCNEYMLFRISRYYINSIRTILMMPINKENKNKLISYEKENKTKFPSIYFAAEKSNTMGKIVKLMRKTHYLAYWFVKFVPENKINCT